MSATDSAIAKNAEPKSSPRSFFFQMLLDERKLAIKSLLLTILQMQPDPNCKESPNHVNKNEVIAILEDALNGNS
jgi:hypothetical protein